MKLKNVIIIVILIALLIGCSKDKVEQIAEIPINSGYSPLIDASDVVGSLDPWQLIDDPQYVSVSQVNYLDSNSLVLLYKSINQIYVYSLADMNVEVVNDVIEDVSIAITYCPQTRSGICWNRVIGNDTMSLAASGLLYRENQMPYDYQTNSVWSQMLLLGVRGKYINQINSTFPLIETNWDLVVKYFPDARVYISSTDVAIVSSEKANELVLNDKSYGIIGMREVSIFNYDQFNSNEIEIINTSLIGKRMSIVGSYDKHFIIAYINNYQMQAIKGEFPNVMIDETGTKWNVFGEAIDGPRMGERLQSPDAYAASGWAWRDLFETVMLNQQ